MNFDRLANAITICRAILDGKQVQIVINIKEPKQPAPPSSTFVPICDSRQYRARIYVRTNRKQTGRWASIPFEIPEGYYQVVFNKS